MLNFLLKTRQMDCVAYTHMGNGHGKHVRLQPPVRGLQGMLLTANGDNIMEMWK